MAMMPTVAFNHKTYAYVEKDLLVYERDKWQTVHSFGSNITDVMEFEDKLYIALED